MRTKTCRLLAAALGCASLMVSCAPKMNTMHVPVSSAQIQADDSFAGKVYAKVNDYRNTQGRTPLQRNAALDRMAQKHCEFLLANRGKFTVNGDASHYGFEERALYAQRAMNMQSVAENVAAGNSNPDQIVAAWTRSSDHAFNMKGDWTSTGIGVAIDKDGSVFATQIFATKSNSLMTMTDRMKQF